jgi:hypothetical protein
VLSLSLSLSSPRIDQTPRKWTPMRGPLASRMLRAATRVDRVGFVFFSIFPLRPSLSVCFPRTCRFLFFFLTTLLLLLMMMIMMMQICTWEGVTRKLTGMMSQGPSFCARFALRITTSLGFVATSMRSILWRPRMGYPFHFFL